MSRIVRIAAIFLALCLQAVPSLGGPAHGPRDSLAPPGQAVVFLVDRSWSMGRPFKGRGPSSMELARQIVARMGRDFHGQGIAVGLASFSPADFSVAPAPRGGDDLDSLLPSLAPSKYISTSINDFPDGLAGLGKVLDATDAGQVAVILVTDGDFSGRVRATTALKDFLDRRGPGTRVHLVNLASTRDGKRTVTTLRRTAQDSAYGWADTMLTDERAYDGFMDKVLHSMGLHRLEPRSEAQAGGTSGPVLPYQKRIDLPKPLASLGPVEEVVVLRFSPGKEHVDRTMFPGLVYLLSRLKQDPGAMAVVKAHGSGQDTGELRERTLIQALAVKNWLTERGISTTRVQVRGMGGAEPRYLEETEAAKGLNERVEVLIR